MTLTEISYGCMALNKTWVNPMGKKIKLTPINSEQLFTYFIVHESYFTLASNYSSWEINMEEKSLHIEKFYRILMFAPLCKNCNH